MKKLTLLLFVAILLTACQPAATSQPVNPPAPMLTSAPVETLVSSVNDLVGIWWFTRAGVMVEIKADSTYRVFSGSETQDEGTYAFEAGKVTWVTGHPTCGDKPATYKAYVTKQDDKPVWLRLQIVGSDPCGARADVTANKAKFQNP